MTRIYKTKSGYEIKKDTGEVYAIIDMGVDKKPMLKYLGKFSDRWTPSGKLVKGIPNHIKQIFFNIQRTK
jgi:hypothetical protein